MLIIFNFFLLGKSFEQNKENIKTVFDEAYNVYFR